MAKSKTDDAAMAIAELREAHAAEIMQLKIAHEEDVGLLRQTITHLQNEVAAGKPEELASLRKMHDADVTEMTTLRRRIRELEKK